MTDGLWVVDSGPMRAGGLELPIRMTVVRLPGGELLLHSPTRATDGLLREIEALGPVRHLVAPNIVHWTYLAEWQRRIPDAITWAAPGLAERPQVRGSGVRLDRELGEEAPPDWAADIGQGIVPGAVGFREVWLFHRPSRTLILTDLVQNLDPAKLPPLTRAFALLSGSTRGKPPRYLRAILKLRAAQARPAVERLVALEPERVVLAHGEWFHADGAARLRHAFEWLLRD